MNKAALVERIAEVVLSRKLPPLLDVKDVSTDDVRIALELKRDADPKMVMAYLFKNTPLQTNVIVNLTCLIPTENAEVGRPERLDLKAILWHFLHFRLEVVTNRLEHELESLQKRIHVLEGFEKVFDALDEIIRIIRKSDGKADSAAKIMKRFELDAEQTDAILELKLYRLARLEILVIQNELADKRKRARQISSLLKDEEGALEGRPRRDRRDPGAVRQERQAPHAHRIGRRGRLHRGRLHRRRRQRRHRVARRMGEAPEGSARSLDDTLREGDSVLAVLPGSTRATVVFFTNLGAAYTSRIIDVPASTGYGEPVQKLFKLRDQERVIAGVSLDPRVAGDITPKKEGAVPRVHAIAVTSDGYSLRFGLDSFVEPSTRAGRRFARPSEGVEVVGVAKISGDEIVIAATEEARAILCRADEVNYLSGPGKGVILIKLSGKDRVLGFIASTGDRDIMRVETSRGAEQTISTTKYEVTGRGGKGRELLQRGQFTRVIPRKSRRRLPCQSRVNDTE